MRISCEVFLAVADMGSITKAAQRLHVTQQCASDHIKRLEREYGVLLFERKPKFKMTEAGEVLLEGLRNLKFMELNVKRNMLELSKGMKGSFSLGISTSRAPLILPGVLSKYYQEYPNVNISFSEEDTQILEEQLADGKVDLFIGVNTTPNPVYRVDTIVTEKILLVISQGLMNKHFSQQEIKQIKKGIDLSCCTDIPFTLSLNTGKVTHVILEYLNSNNIKLNVVYNVSDSRTQTQICSTGICAALCPEMLLDAVYEHNRTCGGQNYLLTIPVKNLENDLRIDLVTREGALYPKYMQYFIQTIKAELPMIARKNVLA